MARPAMFEDVPSIDRFLGAVQGWGESRPDLEAVAMIGSHARRQAPPDSDLDLLLLTGSARSYLDDPSWVGTFGEVERSQEEKWGRVISLRVWYRDSREVEFAIADPAWADLPIDPGTRRVLDSGVRILFDRTGRLSQLR